MLSGDDVIEAARFEAPAARQNTPGDASELVGESDGQHIAVKALPGGLEPAFEPVACPVFRPDQHDPGCLNEEYPQVAIAAPRYAAEDGAIAGRDLLGNEAQPGGKVSAFDEVIAGADCSHHGAGDDWPDPGDTHQPLTPGVLSGHGFDLA